MEHIKQARKAFRLGRSILHKRRDPVGPKALRRWSYVLGGSANACRPAAVITRSPYTSISRFHPDKINKTDSNKKERGKVPA